MPAGVSAWAPLANITLTGSASGVTFSNISQSYRDLMLVANPVASGFDGYFVRFNNDSGANYQFTFIENESAIYSPSNSGNQLSFSSTYSSQGNQIAVHATHFMDYSATDKHKHVIGRGYNPGGGPMQYMMTGRWTNTSAITSIRVFLLSNTFNAGSTFALYGVSA